MIKDNIITTPESQGLDSKHIIGFINKLNRYKVNIHSFMMVRNGNIIAEAYYKPFDEKFQHRLYSCSKTFVALAVGKMVGEGKIKVTDKICDYFPELIEKEPDKWLSETTIEDLLTMSVPMLLTTYHDRKYKEWAWTFFNRYPSVKPAGSLFRYNTSASYLLDVLVEKLSGKTFLEYLRPVFDRIGVSNDIWCVRAPDGYSWGGSGVCCTLRDFAKVGELLLHKGEYNGEQLLPKEYMDKAVSPLVNQITYNGYHPKDCSGYGYQIWVMEDGSYGMQGMGSQFVLCHPKTNFLFVCQADTQGGDQVHFNLIYDYVMDDIIGNLKNEPIDGNNYVELNERISRLSVDDVKFGADSAPMEDKINGVKYVLNENDMGWKWFRISFEGTEGVIEYENKRGVKAVKFGKGKVKKGTFPENYYYDKQVDTPSGRELDMLGVSSWLNEKEFLIRVYITDTCFGNCFMKFGFKGNDVGVSLVTVAEFFMDEYTGCAGGTAEELR